MQEGQCHTIPRNSFFLLIVDLRLLNGYLELEGDGILNNRALFCNFYK